MSTVQAQELNEAEMLFSARVRGDALLSILRPNVVSSLEQELTLEPGDLGRGLSGRIRGRRTLGSLEPHWLLELELRPELASRAPAIPTPLAFSQHPGFFKLENGSLWLSNSKFYRSQPYFVPWLEANGPSLQFDVRNALAVDWEAESWRALPKTSSLTQGRPMGLAGQLDENGFLLQMRGLKGLKPGRLVRDSGRSFPVESLFQSPALELQIESALKELSQHSQALPLNWRVLLAWRRELKSASPTRTMLGPPFQDGRQESLVLGPETITYRLSDREAPSWSESATKYLLDGLNIESHHQACQANLANLRAALEKHKTRTGLYPEKLIGLGAESSGTLPQCPSCSEAYIYLTTGGRYLLQCPDEEAHRGNSP